MIRPFFSLVLASSLTFAHAASVDERISLPAKINGQPVKFFFDTGAGVGCALLGYEVAERLGIKAERPSPDLVVPAGEVPIGKTEPVTFELLGKTTSGEKLEVIESSVVVGNFGHDGLIGWQGLKDNLISLNLRDKRTQILKRLPDDILLWNKLKIRREKKVLVLEFPTTGVSGPPSLITIDTGNAGGVTFPPETWRTWRAAHPEQATTLEASSMPGVGLRVYEEAWADELTVGGVTLRGVPVREANFLEAKLASGGSLGLSALRQFNLIIDNVKGYAYLQPRDEKPLFYDHNRIGAVFTPATPTSNELVATVAAGSPAALAGILNGDVLLKVNELDVTPWRTKPGILPLARFWHGQAGTALALTLKRGDQSLTIAVTLKDIIGPKSTKA